MTNTQLENIAIVRMVARSRLPNRFKRTGWRRCLDGAAWLCDSLPAGRSVAAIISEGNERSMTFWIATNDDCDAAVKHLTNILESLRTVTEENATGVIQNLLEICIRRSERKVFDYIEKLGRALRAARSECSAAQRDMFVETLNLYQTFSVLIGYTGLNVYNNLTISTLRTKSRR